MNVLVTGAKGMLGTAVMTALQNAGISASGYDIEELDITDGQAVAALIATERPSHIVNCAAFTAVDRAETERAIAWSVNVDGVQNLVTACLQYDVALVQISTDYVFDGTKEYYDESATRAPINYYGTTKAEAEEIIETTMTQYKIIRTAWLFGPNGANFFDTMVRIAAAKPVISVVADQVGTPTYTRDLAQSIVASLVLPSGVYHMTNSGQCSWYDFATAILETVGSNTSVTPCTSAEYPQVAKRPTYSVLQNTKTTHLPSWQHAVIDYYKETKV